MAAKPKMKGPKDDPNEIRVVAQLSVASTQGTEIVKSFDKAWHLARLLPVPVTVTFIGFVRKD